MKDFFCFRSGRSVALSAALALLTVVGCKPQSNADADPDDSFDAAEPARLDTSRPPAKKDAAGIEPRAADAAMTAASDAAGTALDTAPVSNDVANKPTDTAAGVDASALPAVWKVYTFDTRDDRNYNAKEGQEGPSITLGCKGKVAADGAKIKMSACGYDVWHGIDVFTYFYTEMVGDGEVVAKIDSIDKTIPSTFGVMMRNDDLFMDTDNPGGMVFYTDGRARWGDRIVTYDPLTHTVAGDGWGPHPPFVETPPIALPIYLKLTRTVTGGKDFLAGFTSKDGKTWVPIPTPLVDGKPGHPPSNTLKQHTDKMFVGIFGFPSQAKDKLIDGIFAEVSVNGVPAKIP